MTLMLLADPVVGCLDYPSIASPGGRLGATVLRDGGANLAAVSAPARRGPARRAAPAAADR